MENAVSPIGKQGATAFNREMRRFEKDTRRVSASNTADRSSLTKSIRNGDADRGNKQETRKDEAYDGRTTRRQRNLARMPRIWLHRPEAACTKPLSRLGRGHRDLVARAIYYNLGRSLRDVQIGTRVKQMSDLEFDKLKTFADDFDVESLAKDKKLAINVETFRNASSCKERVLACVT